MTRPTRALRAALAAMLLVTASGVDPLQSLYRSNREGGRALEQGDVEGAIRSYEEALEMAPDDPRLSYNLGNALARAGRLEEADRAWQRAVTLGEGELRRDAWFNRGVAALGAEAAQPAARSFVEALVVDPADAEARRNLELALRRLQQQQQQQQQQPSQGGDDGQQQEQEQQPQPQDGDQESDENQTGGEQEQREGDSKKDGSSEARPEGEGAQPSEGEGREGEQPAGRQGESPSDAEREMAERILDRLGDEERDARRRALRRRAGPAPETPKEKDW